MTDPYELELSFADSLRKTERLSPATLLRYQLRPLEQICRHAATQTDINRDRLRIVFENGDPVDGAFLFENWNRIPLLGRAEAQANNAALHARTVPERAGTHTTTTTSGSTGRPLTFNTSALADTAGLALFERLLDWHDFDRDGRFAWIRADAHLGQTEPSTPRSWNLRNREAPRFELSKFASMSECAAWLRKIRPQHLMTVSSLLQGLVAEVTSDGGELIALERVIVISETVPDGLAAAIEATFGARLVETYGARESGQIAITCPDHGPALHVMADTMFVEIIREDGQPAQPGEMGAVVMTPFYNYATPLVRYDIGDFAIAGPRSCPCGRTLPLLETIIGRKRALFRFPDGTRRVPRGLQSIRRFIGLRQMQIVQTALDHIEIRYVPDHSHTMDFAGATERVQETFHPSMRVSFTPMDEIPRGSGGKFEEYICQIPAVDDVTP